MEYNSDFRYDLKVGQGAENFLGQLLEGNTLEVKMDKRAHQTGLIFVEFESRGKPSGIATSEADYWAYVIEGKGAVIVSKETMRKKVRQAIRIRGKLKGGDSNTSLGTLVAVKDLLT